MLSWADQNLWLGALVIFLLRILDVSLGTLRIGMLVRGKRTLAGVLSFFEALTWLVAASQVLSQLHSPVQFIAYAGGYAAGTMTGATIERWLAVGQVLMRVIVPVTAADPQHDLRAAGFVVTALNASGRDGEVKLLFTILKRRKLKQAMSLVEQTSPGAFVTVEEVSHSTLTEVASRQERLARNFPRLVRR